MLIKRYLPQYFLCIIVLTTPLFAQNQMVQQNEETAQKKEIVQNQEPTIILFRHAEKMDASRDPDLSTKGIERSKTLYHMLKDLAITEIYSTTYKRTMQTVQPLADSLGISITPYNPQDLTGFAQILKEKSGVILVSGHSNTTPKVTSLLLGSEVARINEDEYDNLFIITSTATNPVLTKLRYPSFY